MSGMAHTCCTAPQRRQLQFVQPFRNLYHSTEYTPAAHLAEQQHRRAGHRAGRQQALSHAGRLGKIVGQRLGAANLLRSGEGQPKR